MYLPHAPIHAQVCVAGAQKILETKQEPTAKQEDARVLVCLSSSYAPYEEIYKESHRKLVSLRLDE